ncbi:MAG: CRISPR-associated helicase Cas3', partial [Thermoanaerobacteraceae bacterium]|nr:CRISPR-associated helicase Cas3' [Thermoanaerobacteraceae bacterium]
FTSMAFALKLRSKIYSKKGYMPRIIYSLPFLSIIEQNAEQFELVLNEVGFNVDTDLLLKHHHLSEIYYKMEENEFEPDEAKILIEGWNSEIIVTTFVQLFHTLLSNKNKNLRKFHRLSGSIIILDEVQSIPFKYWLLVKEILKELVEKFDSYVIFVTATEPLIFERQEVKSLANREKYFSALDRVVIKPKLEKTMMVEELAESVKLESDKSYLFILNTIKSAKSFYELLKVKTEHIGFLSTHVIPKERLNRINKMKRGKIKIAVTTQLVEAGVDIDFDEVYRDLAPLDSINQAAGRCNRNGESQGKVIVVSLKDDRRRYSSYIYDDVLLDITEKILKKHECIKEEDFLNIIDNYYKDMQEKMASDKSRELLSAVYKMKYDSADEAICINDFKLIDNSYPKIDVFIEIDDDAKKVWQDYLRIKEIKNLFERRLEFSRIKVDFYKHTVAIPTTVENLPPEVAGFRYVNINSLEEFYDSETGFKCEGVTPIW